MKRKIGVTTWIFGNIPLVDTAKMISKMGFDGVELYVDINRISAKEARTILEDYGLEIFSLTPGNVDLASYEPNKRMVAINYYKKLIDYSVDLGQPVITCHEHIQHQTDSDQSGTLQFLTESCREIAVHAANSQTKLGFEPLNRYLCRYILNSNDALALLTQINSSNMSIILDAFHMNLEEEDPVKAILKCGSKLSIYQVADSNRKGIGLGYIDFDRQLEALDIIQYTGPIVLEPAHPRQTPGSQVEVNLDEIKRYLSVSLDWLEHKQLA